MTHRPSILFYCQHAMGMGHIVRALALAEALADRFHVMLLNGGVLPTELKIPTTVLIKDLPPLSLHEGQLISQDARYTLDQAKQARINVVCDTFQQLNPDVLLTELFPFGRKRFEFELLPLLDAATSQGAAAPLIVCSLRDILVSRSDEQEQFEQRAITHCNRYYDLVLVHSDPALICFEDCFPTARLRSRIVHTGFVTGKRSSRGKASADPGSLVVSAGGGLYGYLLLSTAIAAHASLHPAARRHMKVIAGPFLPPKQFDGLSAAVQECDDIELVRAVPDMSYELSNACASISQCGYNTALEVLQAGIPALMVPFAEGGEDEQTIRARRLQQLGAAKMLDFKNLSVARLAEEMQKLTEWKPRSLAINLTGARRSAEILNESVKAQRFGKSAWGTRELLEWQV